MIGLVLLASIGCDGSGSTDIDHDPAACPTWLGIEEGRQWFYQTQDDTAPEAVQTVTGLENSVLFTRSGTQVTGDTELATRIELEGRCSTEGFERVREGVYLLVEDLDGEIEETVQVETSYIRRPLTMPVDAQPGDAWTANVSGKTVAAGQADSEWTQTWEFSLGEAEAFTLDGAQVQIVPRNETNSVYPTWFAANVGMVMDNSGNLTLTRVE